MKFSSVLLIAGAALVAAQSLDQLPDCAKECAGKLLTGTDCGMDPKCICANKTFIEDIRGCVAKGCTTDKDREATVSFAAQICKAVQITIDTSLPPATSTSSSSTSTGTSTAPTTTGTGGSDSGKNDTISTPPPKDDSEDSAAGKVGGSVIGVVAALAAAVWML